MASVTGSKLSFYSPDSRPVNLLFTTDGTSVTGSTVAGAFNIEVFTTALIAPSVPGVDANILIEGAQAVPNTTNEVQAGSLSSTEEMRFGDLWLVDHTGGETINAATVATDSVSGSRGDTILGGTDPSANLLVDASNTRPDVVVGPETITGAGGPTTVWAAGGDSITGGIGNITVAGDASYTPPGGTGRMTITGSTGSLTAFDIGAHNIVTGSQSGFTFLDDSYTGGVGNTITAGAGNAVVTAPSGAVMTLPGAVTLHGSFIKAGVADVIDGGHTVSGGTVGGGAMLVVGNISDTISAGLSSAPTVWGGTADSVSGGSPATLEFTDPVGEVNTVAGGSGGLYAFNLGTGDSIVGGSGGTVSGTSFSNEIDDSYDSAKGSNTLVGGSGSSFIIAGPNDSVAAGSGSLLADIRDYLGTTNTVTVDLSNQGSSGATLRDDRSVTVPSVPNPTGANASVVGFSTATDNIASATDVDGGGTFHGTSVVQNGGTLLTFTDGTTMFLSGVTNPGSIKFIQ
jgi:hypothetical protein